MLRFTVLREMLLDRTNRSAKGGQVDLNTIASIRRPRSRDELALGRGEAFLGGGSWLFSEPQTHLTGLVDLTALGWEPITVTDAGMTVSATCTLAELAAFPAKPGWAAHPLFRQCCTALFGSFKVWNVATVGGNICMSLPAGPMISLAAALDADAVIWMPHGGERRVPVLEFVTGARTNVLLPGELLRAIEFPLTSLRARTGYRRMALSALGRSGTLVVARHAGDGTFAVTVSAGTDRPVRLSYAGIPTSAELADDVNAIDRWYDDAHGAPDWRRAMSALLAEQLREELAAAA